MAATFGALWMGITSWDTESVSVGGKTASGQGQDTIARRLRADQSSWITNFTDLIKPNIDSTEEKLTFWTSSSIVLIYGISNGLVYLNMQNEDDLGGKYHRWFYNYSRRISSPAAFLHTAVMIYFALTAEQDKIWP